MKAGAVAAAARIGSLDELKAATMRCRECPIGEFASQSVIGEGNPKATRPRPSARPRPACIG